MDMISDVARCAATVPLHTPDVLMDLLRTGSSHVGEAVLIHDLRGNSPADLSGRVPGDLALKP